MPERSVCSSRVLKALTLYDVPGKVIRSQVKTMEVLVFRHWLRLHLHPLAMRVTEVAAVRDLWAVRSTEVLEYCLRWALPMAERNS